MVHSGHNDGGGGGGGGVGAEDIRSRLQLGYNRHVATPQGPAPST